MGDTVAQHRELKTDDGGAALLQPGADETSETLAESTMTVDTQQLHRVWDGIGGLSGEPLQLISAVFRLFYDCFASNLC